MDLMKAGLHHEASDSAQNLARLLRATYRHAHSLLLFVTRLSVGEDFLPCAIAATQGMAYHPGRLLKTMSHAFQDAK